MTVPKKQHVIPELHLKHFADANGRVCTYDAVNGKSWFSAVGETAVEGHFYSGDLDDGTKDTWIETHLAEIESRAAPVYEELLRGNTPYQSQARMDFAHFLGLMFSRTRACAEWPQRFGGAPSKGGCSPLRKTRKPLMLLYEATRRKSGGSLLRGARKRPTSND